MSAAFLSIDLGTTRLERLKVAACCSTGRLLRQVVKRHRPGEQRAHDWWRVALRLPDAQLRRGWWVAFLRNGQPSVRTRNHQLSEGCVLFDPREMRPDQVPTVAARVREFFGDCEHRALAAVDRCYRAGIAFGRSGVVRGTA